MKEIQKIEEGTDLERVAVISRIGMAIASAHSDQMDADAETASSSALIDLAERLSKSVVHGNLREILVKAENGFVILQFINEEYMVFGGISDPLRVGYYMEYLRNISHKFAYIIAGNTVTEQLKKEIEANRDRDFLKKQQSRVSLSDSFVMDKNQEKDKEAMEGVLSFLKDWGGEEGETPTSSNNIVGIDNDVMFGMDDLAPTPISQDQISQAKSITTTEEQPVSSGSTKSDMEDIFAALDSFSSSSSTSTPPAQPSSDSNEENVDDILSVLDEFASSTEPITPQTTPENASSSDDLEAIMGALDEFPVSNKDSSVETNIPVQVSEENISVPSSDVTAGGIPDDILAELSEISESTSSKTFTSKSREDEKKQTYPHGIPIYKNEVPPVPLEDYVSFEIGTLSGASPENQQVSSPQASPEFGSVQAEEYSSESPNETLPESMQPNFDAIASEYDDVEIEDEDAMLQVLEELDFDKIGKKKKE